MENYRLKFLHDEQRISVAQGAEPPVLTAVPIWRVDPSLHLFNADCTSLICFIILKLLFKVDIKGLFQDHPNVSSSK